MLAAVFAETALVLALNSGGLRVESSSPDALCPPLGVTQQAVGARLGSVELDGIWIARYGLVHRGAGDFVSLVVIDPAGEEKLIREFPVRSGDCMTIARVIALVLERYFTRPEASSVSLRPGSPDADAAPKELTPVTAHANDVRATAVAAPSKQNPQPIAYAAADSAALETPSSPIESRAQRGQVDAGLWWSGSWLAPWVGGALRLGVVDANVRLGVDLQDHEAARGGGTVRVRRLPAAVGLKRTLLAQDALAVDVGFAAAGVLELGSSVGLARTASGVRLVPGALVALRVTSTNAGLLAPFFELNGTWQAVRAAPAFEVEGERVLQPQSFALGAAFGLTLAL